MRRLSDIDLRLIRIFCTVVDCHGFRDAQIALNMAQSTLSTHIAALEDKLGTRLCDRGRRGFRLTTAGEETYAAAQSLLRDIERFEASLGRIHGKQTTRLRVGLVDAVSTFAAIDLPDAVARFVRLHPEVLVDMDTDNPAALQKSLLTGMRDIVIGPSFQPMPGLEYLELTSEEHHLFCGSAHPWFSLKDEEISQADFLQAAFSVRSYQHFDDTYRLGRVTARARVGSMEAQEILILSGAYVGFLPDHRGMAWATMGKMRSIKPDLWSFRSRFHLAFDPHRQGAAIRRAFARALTG